MRVLRTLRTPWAPYSVMFSRDGTRLAVGGGSWYGEGGLLLADLLSGETQVHPCTELPSPGRRLGPFTVSGVCFSPDDRHLAASTWASAQYAGPTLLFEVPGLQLAHRETFVPRRQAGHRDLTPTGVLLAGEYLITRNHRAHVNDVIAVRRPRRPLNLDQGPAPHHLTSSRVVVVKDTVITGRGGVIPWQEVEADPRWREPDRAADGLVTVSLHAEAHLPQVIAVRGCRRVTAIGARPSGDRFVTGGLDGELDEWTWDSRWGQHRLRAATDKKAVADPELDLAWAAYNANSIVGICSLVDGDRWASVSAGGEVCLWDGPSLTRSWQLPEPGSPRSLAAHPDRPWLAVGVKKGGWARPESAVVLAEVDRVTLAPTWRTPAVLALAHAADRERLATGGPLDPAHLAVLADALEDAGCTDGRSLRHLRGHDPRLRGCWAVDQLLGRA
jgi:WD40 repeat protein